MRERHLPGRSGRWALVALAVPVLLTACGSPGGDPSPTESQVATPSVAAPRISASSTFESAEDLAAAVQASGVSCSDYAPISPPGTGAADQGKCDSQFGHLGLYIFSNGATQQGWSQAFTLLCGAGGPLSSLYVSGGDWAILPNDTEGDTIPTALAQKLGLSPADFCAGFVAPTPPPVPSCASFTKVTASYKRESGVDAEGTAYYWPKITVRNPSAFAIDVLIGGSGSATFSLSPSTAPSVTWSTYGNFTIQNSATESITPDGTGVYGSGSLEVFPGDHITKFTVTAEITAAAPAGDDPFNPSTGTSLTCPLRVT